MASAVIDHAPAFEDDTPFVDETEITTYCRRLEDLLDAGYSRVVADALACDPDVDLRRACSLRACGCAEKAAFLIVS